MWKYERLYPWFKRNKNSWFFKYLEGARWFPWYGRRVVYVKVKDPSTLTPTQLDVKVAITNKDYKRALEIVNTLPVTAQTMALKQIIEAKIN